MIDAGDIENAKKTLTECRKLIPNDEEIEAMCTEIEKADSHE